MTRKVKIDLQKLTNLVDKFSHLTDREYQVAKLLNQKQSSKQIGEKLNISSHTVDCHRRNIITKLELIDTRCLNFLKMD